MSISAAADLHRFSDTREIDIALFLAHGESPMRWLAFGEDESDWWALRHVFCEQLAIAEAQ